MKTPGTSDAVATDTSDTTDTNGGQPVSEPPVTRPQPGVMVRSYDAFCGVACIAAGGYLLGRAFGVIDYPETFHPWGAFGSHYTGE